jgi:hypothetical protein
MIMTRQALEKLAQQAGAGDKAAADKLLSELEAILRQLDADTLHRVAHTALELRRQCQILAAAANSPDGKEESTTNSMGPKVNHPETSRPTPIAPELMDWVRQQFTEEELADGLREMRERGGIELPQLLEGIEAQPDSP